MHVLQVHNTYQQAGGEDVVVSSEQALLKKYRHQVSQYFVSNDLINGAFQKIITAFQTPYSPEAKKRFAREIAALGPDIVHVHNTFPLLTPSIYDACREAGVPVVQTLHNYRNICANALLMRNGRPCEDCIGGSPYQAVLHRCYRGSRMGSLAVARMIDVHSRKGTWNTKVDRFIALTEFAKAKFIEAGFRETQIAVKSNFVELSETHMTDPIPRNSALFVGRLSEEKGIHTLLRAW